MKFDLTNLEVLRGSIARLPRSQRQSSVKDRSVGWLIVRYTCQMHAYDQTNLLRLNIICKT